MLVLGIETSCDDTAVALVEDGRRVRASVVAAQHELHRPYGGVVPEIASRAHTERLLPVMRTALAQAGAGLRDIDAVAVGHRPGLIGSLLVGVSAAKALSWSLGVPLVGVDHVHAHLYAGALEAEPPEFPALGLVLSGGHSALYACRSAMEIERLGGTIDDALGEAFDKAAAILGLAQPGGPAIDRLASEPGADDQAIELPVSRLGVESLDFSFSGLKTALLYAVRGVPGPDGRFPRDVSALSDRQRRDCAASFQRAACRAVVLKLERAIDRGAGAVGEPFRSLITGGGVLCNSRLRRELADCAQRHGLALHVPPPAWCADNAAMIAGLAYHRLCAGQRDDLSLRAEPTTLC